MDAGSRSSGDAADTSAEVPDTVEFRKQRHLKHETADHGGYTGVWDVCGVPLHARLVVNKDVEDCMENAVLHRIQGTQADEDEPLDEEELDDAFAACRVLFYPFIARLVRALDGASVPSVVDGIVPSEKDGAYRVQLKTVGGALVSVPHEKNPHKLLAPPGPVTNPAPDVPKVFADNVHLEKKLRHGMAIVCVDGKRRLLKQVYGASSERDFVREATVLSRLPPHPRVVNLVGLVVLPDGSVDGMLLELIDGVALQAWRPPDGQRIDQTLKDRWLEQIEDGLKHVHSNGEVWGDVKAANVLIDKLGDAHIIDFDGGFTAGWVPSKQAETTEGDLVGMVKIAEFVTKMQ